LHLTGYQESLRYTTKIKSLSENKTEKKQQMELNKGKMNAMIASYKHRITTLVGDGVILPVVSPTVTRAK